MPSVIISIGSEVEVDAPYDRRFHDAADELGGTLAPERDVWRFSRDDEDRVRQLCSEIFSSETNASPIYGPASDTTGIAVDPPDQWRVSAHQQRADLLVRLDTLLDEVAEVHAALQSLTKAR